MKRTRQITLFPMGKGLDLTSVPGTQDPKSLYVAKNIAIRTRPSLKKRPGARRIPYIGNDSGVQAVTQFFASSNGSVKEEVVRVRKGIVESKRFTGGPDAYFVEVKKENGERVTDISDSDVVTFERISNILVIHFENRRPLYYSIGGFLSDLPIINSHIKTPPGFSRNHNQRLFYSGRPSDPHRMWASAVNNVFDYTLNGGGFSMRVMDGDGDPVGITGISPVFRGDLYVYKWLSVYRIFQSQFGYGIDQITSEAGGVNHSTIVATQNELYSVATDGIHALTLTDKYGAAESATVTFPIYEWFQENVNWSAYKHMKMTYDKLTNTLLLSFPSSMSMVNDKVLGYNVVTKDFFEWESCEYPALGSYIDFGRQKTFVAVEEKGIAILDDQFYLNVDEAINIEIETGPIFPMGSPKASVNFTQGWVLAKPTDRSVKVNILASLDGKEEFETELDTIAGGYGSLIDEEIGGLIGSENIGKMREDMVIMPFKLNGNANSVKFRVTQIPPKNDKDQPCEIYGIVYEFDYEEDTSNKVEI